MPRILGGCVACLLQALDDTQWGCVSAKKKYKRVGGRIKFLPRGASKYTPPPPSPGKCLLARNEGRGGGGGAYIISPWSKIRGKMRDENSTKTLGDFVTRAGVQYS